MQNERANAHSLVSLIEDGEVELYARHSHRRRELVAALVSAAPNRIYKDAGWVNWGDWLGTGRVYWRAPGLPVERSREMEVAFPTVTGRAYDSDSASS